MCRSEVEIEKLIDKLRSFRFFQDKRLSNSDYRDIAQSIKYQELEAGRIVY